MENEKKEVEAAVEGKKVTLEHNTSGAGSACYFCGQFVPCGGLDFFIAGEKDFRVCVDCAKQKAPELYLIWRDAHRWEEERSIEAFRRGVGDGKKDAGEMILHAMHEEPLERIHRVCVQDLGVEDEPSF